MTKKQETRIIDHTNRTVIALLSLTGMMLDGCELADVVLQVAVVLWLWMPEWRLVERALLHHLQPSRIRVRRAAA